MPYDARFAVLSIPKCVTYAIFDPRLRHTTRKQTEEFLAPILLCEIPTMSSLDELTPVGSTVWGYIKPGSTDPFKYSYAPSQGTVIRPAQVTCGSCKIEHDFCLQLNHETETDPKRRADVLSAISGAITTCFDPTCGKTLAIPFANHGEDSQIVPFNPDTSTNIVKTIEGGRGTADGKLQGLKGSKAIAR